MPIQASKKEDKGIVYNKLLDKRRRMSQKFQVHDLVRTVDLKETFSKSDTINWSYKLYKNTQIFSDTIPN